MDCPDRLTTGVSVILSVEVYLLQAAFQPIKVDKKEKEDSTYAREGAESIEEVVLRERKNAVVQLFEMVSLRPHAGVNAKGRKSEKEILKQVERSATMTKTKEIVGDGEEIEVDDSEQLADGDLEMIYKKLVFCYPPISRFLLADRWILRRAQHHDQTMAEMEPAETFSLELRAYQKQALRCIHSVIYC